MNAIDLFAFEQQRLQEVLFPVEFRPVWVPLVVQDKARLFPEEKLTELERFQAVTDVEEGYVFAIVGKDYELITNQEAIDLGKECFRTVFKLTDDSKMRLFNIVMPRTRSFCHIDFLYSEGIFDSGPADPWAPFLRITNSYNRTFSLNFDLGFCRGICRNGMIFGKKSIEFKFVHSKRTGRDPIAAFRLREGEFVKLEADFVEKLRNLRRYHVPPRLMWPLFCKVFRASLPGDKPLTARQKDIWERRELAVQRLTTEYFQKLGENGYAALSVLTDYASRPTVEISGEQRVNTLQTYSGQWVQEFVSAIQRKEFSFEVYLGEYAQLAS